jgi:thiosulfate/3-mercaptopyruvate sulfurtransferase
VSIISIPGGAHDRSAALVSTDWVAAHLRRADLRVVEVDVNTGSYEESHIPGAAGWNWTTQLCNRRIRDILAREDLEALLSQTGIARESTVVLYGDHNNWFAAWAFWQLKLYGHPDVRLMDGGKTKWIEEGRPLSQEVPRFQATHYAAARSRTAWRALRHEVEQIVRNRDALLLDVRTPQEFSGELLAPPGLPETCQRGGHIPGAVNITWTRVFDEDGTLLGSEQLQALYREKGVTPDRRIITYCRIGERAAHTWFVLKFVLGYPDVRNYDGSWVEWGNLVRAPIDAGTC